MTREELIKKIKELDSFYEFVTFEGYSMVQLNELHNRLLSKKK